jgi:hypothetical protein
MLQKAIQKGHRTPLTSQRCPPRLPVARSLSFPVLSSPCRLNSPARGPVCCYCPRRARHRKGPVHQPNSKTIHRPIHSRTWELLRLQVLYLAPPIHQTRSQPGLPITLLPTPCICWQYAPRKSTSFWSRSNQRAPSLATPFGVDWCSRYAYAPPPQRRCRTAFDVPAYYSTARWVPHQTALTQSKQTQVCRPPDGNPQPQKAGRESISSLLLSAHTLKHKPLTRPASTRSRQHCWVRQEPT